MTKKLLILSFGFGGLSLLACLTAPGETRISDAQSELSCTAQEHRFNGSCRRVCATTADCRGGERCMTVTGGQQLCLDYTHCAHLESDTRCQRVGGPGYGTSYGYSSYGYASSTYPAPWQYGYAYGPTYGYGPSYGYGTSYGYSGYGVAYGYPTFSGGYGSGGNVCVGDARWVAEPATGDPACGESHLVARCQPTPFGCGFVTETTTDVADP